MDKKTTVLMILDGFGISENEKGNCIKAANTPNIDFLMKNYPYELGNASGLYVGLPDGQMGNSEVGHLNIGAGRIVYQELTRITKSIEDGDFFENEELLKAVNNCIKNDSSLHIFGLLSDGGVHSHINHLFALLELAKKQNLKKVFVHCFLDGRDTPPESGITYIELLENKIKELNTGKIATVIGRYYAMDRDKRFERVEKAFDAIANGIGKYEKSAISCIKNSYKDGVTDEFVIPTIITNDDGKPVATVNSNDSIIFFNFRPDRAREITRAFTDTDFSEFDRKKEINNLCYICFTQYDALIKNVHIAFKPQTLNNTLGEYISKLGLKQLRTAETEKYAHVTFFFNGGVEAPNENEERILVPSPKVATYDLMPEMSAYGVTEKLISAILSKSYDLIVINYANPDMVGHTGVIPAAIKAVEVIDECVGKVYKAIIDTNSQMFICADHGNCDKLIDLETGEPFTAHTTNPVPFILVNRDDIKGLKKGGKLADIAPTLLDMMNLPKPPEMTGESLLIK